MKLYTTTNNNNGSSSSCNITTLIALIAVHCKLITFYYLKNNEVFITYPFTIYNKLLHGANVNVELVGNKAHDVLVCWCQVVPPHLSGFLCPLLGKQIFYKTDLNSIL